MKEKITFSFEILAGRHDLGDISWKYADDATNLPEALHKYQNTQGYPVRQLRMYIECDGVTTEHCLFGGDSVETRMREGIADLWNKVCCYSATEPTNNWRLQLLDIEREMKRWLPRPWQDIHQQFARGELTWTEALEALMNQCGYSLEEALRCLAEHFDRRPTITITTTEA